MSGSRAMCSWMGLGECCMAAETVRLRGRGYCDKHGALAEEACAQKPPGGAEWRPSSDYSPLEIAWASAEGKMWVSPRGLGWVRDLVPSVARCSTEPAPYATPGDLVASYTPARPPYSPVEAPTVAETPAAKLEAKDVAKDHTSHVHEARCVGNHIRMYVDGVEQVDAPPPGYGSWRDYGETELRVKAEQRAGNRNVAKLEAACKLAEPTLPTEPAARKAVPIFSGVLKYFPLALAAVAELSRKGNEQHNPGMPLHWDRSKSTDELDALTRHLLEAGTLDTDGIGHSVKVAWRALANLQKELEQGTK